jgi:tRNA(Ser,Leu) C12 N-acetylase TAN1
MEDWNVVVTVREHGYRQALEFLQVFGAVAGTEYYNVLTLRVADLGSFPASLQDALTRQPALRNALARIIPVEWTFLFQDPAEFERKACEALGGWIGRLGGHSFHVRMHRRGFKDRLGSQTQEQWLDHWLVEQVQTTGSSAHVTFEDPDFIIAVETVGQRGGASIWDRSDRAHYAFLGLD